MMDSFEVNKIIGALLAVLTFALGLHILIGELYKTKPPAQMGFSVQVQTQTAAAAAPAEPARPIAEIMREADAARGQAAFRPCAACHTVDKGGRNGTGPNLWDTYGGRKAHIDGFNYSQPCARRRGRPAVERRGALSLPRSALALHARHDDELRRHLALGHARRPRRLSALAVGCAEAAAAVSRGPIHGRGEAGPRARPFAFRPPNRAAGRMTRTADPC